jgi:DNA polymerase-4
VPPFSSEELASIALSLRERLELGSAQLFRLVGVGLSNFPIEEEEELPLFDTAESNAATDTELEGLPQR